VTNLRVFSRARDSPSFSHPIPLLPTVFSSPVHVPHYRSYEIRLSIVSVLARTSPPRSITSRSSIYRLFQPVKCLRDSPPTRSTTVSRFACTCFTAIPSLHLLFPPLSPPIHCTTARVQARDGALTFLRSTRNFHDPRPCIAQRNVRYLRYGRVRSDLTRPNRAPRAPTSFNFFPARVLPPAFHLTGEAYLTVRDEARLRARPHFTGTRDLSPRRIPPL